MKEGEQDNLLNFPNHVTFICDGNECELVELIKKTNDAKYIYTKSETKLGLSFNCDLRYLKNLLDAGLLEAR